jgi:predicted DNA-binding transcriptional regulator YafY
MCAMLAESHSTEPDSMSDRYLEILKRIPRHRKISATELFQQMQDAGMDVTRRSFQRYMEDICANYDIDEDRNSRPHGYSWKHNAVGLSLPGLNAQEALLLLLAEQQLTPLLPASLKSSLAPFFEQAKRLLGNAHIAERPGEKKRQAREWLDKVRVISTTVPVLPPKLAEGVFEAVSETLLHNRMLNIVYRNAKGEIKDKRIKPLGLAQAEARLFLVCLFDGYSDTRNLALHRILSAQDTGMPFERPADFDLKTYDANGQFAYGRGELIKLKMWVSEYLALLMEETPLLEPEPWRGELPRNGALLQATVVQSDLLVRWLKSQGDGVRAIKALKITL